jgi:hypothetical protein
MGSVLRLASGIATKRPTCRLSFPQIADEVQGSGRLIAQKPEWGMDATLVFSLRKPRQINCRQEPSCRLHGLIKFKS